MNAARARENAAAAPLLCRRNAIADNLGRLRRLQRTARRRRTPRLTDRIAFDVHVLDAMLEPTAAELYREALAICGDEQVALEHAFTTVEHRDRELSELLGDRRRDMPPEAIEAELGKKIDDLLEELYWHGECLGCENCRLAVRDFLGIAQPEK